MKHPFPSLSIAVIPILLFSGCTKNADRSNRTESQVMTFQAPATYPEFSGARAFELLKAQVAFGSRSPNTVGHARCLDFFMNHLESFADSVFKQEFSMQGYDGERLSLKNVIASFRPEMKTRILLCAHWDTRPHADKETEEDKKRQPIAGANDGASGVAVLLHIAELLRQSPPPVGVDLVLFDGEDYGREGDEGMYCLGSKYFAASLDPGYKPQFGILLDLVGDKEAFFPIEGHSAQYANDVVNLVWNSAERLGMKQFIRKKSGAILDDHIALNKTGGIKTINIIDLDLVGHADTNPRRKYWHTLSDTPDQCSPETLGQVGKLLLYLLFGHRPA